MTRLGAWSARMLRSAMREFSSSGASQGAKGMLTSFSFSVASSRHWSISAWK